MSQELQERISDAYGAGNWPLMLTLIELYVAEARWDEAAQWAGGMCKCESERRLNLLDRQIEALKR